MKLAVFALVLSTAGAFQPPSMTFAVGKKKAPAPKAAVTKAVSSVKSAVKAAPAPKAAVTKAVKDVKSVAAQAKAVVKKADSSAKKAVPKAAVTKAVKDVKTVKSVAKSAPKSAFSFTKSASPIKKAAAAPIKKPSPIKATAAIKKAVAPKKPPAPVRKVVAAVKRSTNAGTVPSIAIPYEQAPATLDGSLVGDVGFDPCFLSTKSDAVAPYFNKLFSGNAPIDGLTWYREAELMHGRIAMLAALGFIVPGFATFPGNDWTGYTAFSYPNPLDALANVPSASLFQIFAFMSALEFRRIGIIQEQGANYMAGDSQRWGQGEGRWNPFNFNYSPEQYAEKQLQEIKHGRLAMIGLLGLYFQANASGVNVIQQWSTALSTPDYYAKSGYFFPDGI
jgi:hypothetical protein